MRKSHWIVALVVFSLLVFAGTSVCFADSVYDRVKDTGVVRVGLIRVGVVRAVVTRVDDAVSIRVERRCDGIGGQQIVCDEGSPNDLQRGVDPHGASQPADFHTVIGGVLFDADAGNVDEIGPVEYLACVHVTFGLGELAVGNRDAVERILHQQAAFVAIPRQHVPSLGIWPAIVCGEPYDFPCEVRRQGLQRLPCTHPKLSGKRG